MRRMLALLCALCLAAGAMTPALAEDDFYAALLAQVEALSALNAEAAEISSGARDELVTFAVSYVEAVNSMGTYDQEGFKAQLAARGERMDACAVKLQVISEGLSLMRGADAAQEDALAACRDYADEALAAVNCFRRTNAFHQAQYAASAPLDALSSKDAVDSGFGGDFAFAYAWEKGAAQVYSDFCRLSPPAYLSQAWEAYLTQVNLFATMCRMRREGVGYGDVMRLYGSSQLLAREYNAMTKYEMMMYELHRLEYCQVEARLAFLAENVEPPLRTACANGGAADYAYRTRQPGLTLDYALAGAVYPNLYHSMDSAVNLITHTDWGTRDIVVTAQIVGFSQEYRQKLTVGTDLMRLTIKPPVLPEIPKLSTTRDTQLTFTVTDARTGELLVQESKTLTLHSLYDFELIDDEFGTVRYDDILAWLTPESEGILKVRREAISWMEEHITGMNSLAGYQNTLHVEDDQVHLNTQLQAIALQGAISDLGVRYNWGAYSLNSFQRVLTPDAVVESRSGICIETAVLLASALESTGMHAMILFIPGHAQVGLETWRDSHEYFLLETTTLPFTSGEEDIAKFCQYLTQEQWQNYLSHYAQQGVAYVVDCDLVKEFDYQGLY